MYVEVFEEKKKNKTQQSNIIRAAMYNNISNLKYGNS